MMDNIQELTCGFLIKKIINFKYGDADDKNRLMNSQIPTLFLQRTT